MVLKADKRKIEALFNKLLLGKVLDLLNLDKYLKKNVQQNK